jgi:hypothetical protein
MQATPEYVVVVPSGHFVPTDAFLEDRVYELLQADRPTLTTRALLGLADVPLYGFGSVVLLKALGLVGPRRTPQMLKGMGVEDAKTWLVALLRALYTTDPGTMLPNLWVLKPDDPRLGQLHSVEDRFVQNVVYAAHPAEPASFIRVADFHPYLVQDKRAEFVRLAAALGAKSIALVDNLSSRRAIGATASISDAAGAGQVGASVDSKKAVDSSFNLSVTFHPDSFIPHIPEGLSWLRREPLWKAMAETRTARPVASYNVRFAYKQDFSVSAGLAGSFTALGFNIGGSFSAFEEIEQEYLIEFFPPRT